MGWMCLEIPTLFSQQQVSLHCLTPCSSLQSSLGLRSPPFAGHCIALNCYMPAIVIKSSLVERQSFSSGFWHAWVCLFGGLRSRHFLQTQEIFNCTASWWIVFLTWWLLTQAQADGHLFFSLWTFPLLHFQNLIEANFGDISYLCAILSLIVCCSLHWAQRN